MQNLDIKAILTVIDMHPNGVSFDQISLQAGEGLIPALRTLSDNGIITKIDGKWKRT